MKKLFKFKIRLTSISFKFYCLVIKESIYVKKFPHLPRRSLAKPNQLQRSRTQTRSNAKQNPLQHNRSETELHQISPALTGQEKILKNKSKIRLFDLKPNFTQLLSYLSPLKFDISRLSFLFLLSFYFILLSSLTAQVKIKEKVEIKLKTKVVNNKTFNVTASTHTIKAVFDWDSSGITHQDLRAKITLISYECKFDTFKAEYGYNGHEEVETSTDLAGTYIVQVHTQANNYYTTHDSTWFDFGIGGKTWFFVDGKKIDGSSGSIRPWRSDLVFTPDKGALCPGEAIDYEIGDSNNTCKSIKWSAVADQITLSVIQGAQYVSFYDVSGQNLGTTISGLEENINKYQLKYDNPNTATNKDEKVILEVTVNGISTRDTLIVYPKSNNYFVNGEIKDNVQRIVENEKLTMQAWLESGGICGGKIESSDNTTYTAEIIQGAEYGELLNPKNDSKGDSLGGIVAENDKILIDFYANGTIPANDKEIKVRISNSKENTQPLELSFLVGPSDVVVTFEPKELAAGDTANVIIKHRKEDGTLENFPNDQDYEVRLIEGNDYGTILSSNGADTSDYFESVSDGIKFITYKDIDTNNVEVRLKISTYYFPLASVQESGNKGKSNVNGVAFVEQIYGIGSIVIKKDEHKLKILKPSLLVEPYIYYINATPTMPNITLRAERSVILNLPGETANWTCTLSYSYPIVYSTRMPNGDTLTSTQTYTRETTFDGSDVTEWNLNFNNSEPIIGGEARITVTATVDGEQYADTIVVYIRGENPDDADVEAATDDNGQLTMIETEVPGYSQFDTETYAVPNDGLPLRSDADDHGWGLGQIDDRYHIITTELLWDWTANLEWSLSYYNGHRDRAERRLENDGNLDNPIAGHTRQSMIDYEGYARYNSNWYAHVWEWIPPTEQNPGRWVRNVTILLDGERVYSGEVDRHLQNYESNY